MHGWDGGGIRECGARQHLGPHVLSHWSCLEVGMRVQFPKYLDSQSSDWSCLCKVWDKLNLDKYLSKHLGVPGHQHLDPKVSIFYLSQNRKAQLHTSLGLYSWGWGFPQVKHLIILPLIPECWDYSHENHHTQFKNGVLNIYLWFCTFSSGFLCWAYLFVCWDRVYLCSLGYPRTFAVDQACLEFCLPSSGIKDTGHNHLDCLWDSHSMHILFGYS